MPKILDRLVNQLKSKGKSLKNAYAIAVSSLQKAGDLKKGSLKATKKGIKRGKMTPKQREKSRAKAYSKGKNISKTK